MSNVRADVTLPVFQAAWMSVTKVRMALSVDELERPQNWLGGTKLSSPARKVSHFATIHSRTFPKHSRRVISL